jgi:transposase InsO family protein
VGVRSSSWVEIPLPRGWLRCVKSAVLHVVSLARFATIHTRGWAADSLSARLRLKASLDEARSEVALLEEEIRIKDARMAILDPHRRPHYPPTERLAILELRAARGWSAIQTARRFMVEPGTIAEWMGRLDEEGDGALLKTAEPVNRFPDFVRHMVRRLKVLCPSMGKKRLAQTLARAGLHLGVTTARRMLKEKDGKGRPAAAAAREEEVKAGSKPVTAKSPSHVWQVDLTVAPTSAGFWVAWLPFSLPQVWPFCWWVACVVDHYSRRVMGFAVFGKEPKSRDLSALLGRTIRGSSAVPRYILSDKGRQFWCRRFKAWCKRRGIRPRYASTGGQVRATAIVERFIRSLKDEWLGRSGVPFRRKAMRRHLSTYLEWFHEYRPHQGLGGRTPLEVYGKKRPANRRPRHEPRPRWPAGAPCALPQARLRSPRGSRLAMTVRFHGGSHGLPIVKLRRVA